MRSSRYQGKKYSSRAGTYKGNYKAYMDSEEWMNKKREYYNSELPVICFHCKNEFGPFELHHRTYLRLEFEELTDLVPFCEGCHQLLTNIYKVIPNHADKHIWDATTLWIHPDLKNLFQKTHGTKYFNTQEIIVLKNRRRYFNRIINKKNGGSQSYIPTYFTTPVNWTRENSEYKNP